MRKVPPNKSRDLKTMESLLTQLGLIELSPTVVTLATRQTSLTRTWVTRSRVNTVTIETTWTPSRLIPRMGKWTEPRMVVRTQGANYNLISETPDVAIGILRNLLTMSRVSGKPAMR